MPNFLDDYIPVKERIQAMRKEHPDWTVLTDMDLTDGHWLARTSIRDGQGHPIANGHAYEKAQNEFDMEKAETSAVGRALVFAGYVDSVKLSREEHERAQAVQRQRPSQRREAPQRTQNRPPAVRTPDKGPATPQGVVESREEMAALAAQREVEGEPAANVDDLMRLHKPPQSAPKGFWQEFVKELVAAGYEAKLAIPWKDLTGGKGFDKLTTAELRHLVEDLDKWLNEPEVEG